VGRPRLVTKAHCLHDRECLSCSNPGRYLNDNGLRADNKRCSREDMRE
jgi:hypothetical protein